ncbi:MAG: hypothetical protein AABY48_00545 [Nitrospirota bacterium]|jgi:hypothetical protein
MELANDHEIIIPGIIIAATTSIIVSPTALPGRHRLIGHTDGSQCGHVWL